MESLTITANYKVLRIYYAVLGICGAIIISSHVYNYFTGEMIDRWFLNLSMGLFLAIGGGGYALGFLKPRIPEIVVDNEGISSNNSAWDNSFKWSKFNNVTLYKNKIQVQFAESGLKNEIGIPYLIRFGTNSLYELNNTLKGFCDKYGVEFTSEVNNQLKS